MDQSCWEIIQCNEEDTCPARSNVKKQCWEVMGEHNSFQCHYGICDECIVYLSKSNDSSSCSKKMNEVLQKREAIRHFC